MGFLGILLCVVIWGKHHQVNVSACSAWETKISENQADLAAIKPNDLHTTENRLPSSRSNSLSTNAIKSSKTHQVGLSTKMNGVAVSEPIETTFATTTVRAECRYKIFHRNIHLQPIDIENLLCACSGLCGQRLTKVLGTVRKMPDRGKLQVGISSYRKHEIILELVLLFLIFFFGCAGNLVAIYGMSHCIKKNPTNVFMISLAIIDCILLSHGVPLKIAELLYADRNLGQITCKVLNYLRDFTCTCSMLTMTAISFERYYAVCYPFRAKMRCTYRRALLSNFLLWILACLLACPTAIFYTFWQSKLNNQHICMAVFHNESYQKLYGLYNMFLLFVTPLTIMCYTYGSICIVLWNSFKQETTLHKEEFRIVDCSGGVIANINRRKKVIRMLLLMLAVFTGGWAPKQIYLLLESFNTISQIGRLRTLGILEALLYLQAAIEPYIAIGMSARIRRPIKKSNLCRIFCVNLGRCNDSNRNRKSNGQFTQIDAAEDFHGNHFNIQYQN